MAAAIQVGEIRNNLKVLKMIREPDDKGIYYNFYYCICLNCGKEIKCKSNFLKPCRKGNGCLECSKQKQLLNLTQSHQPIDMINKIYGDWLVIKQSENNSPYKPYNYYCKCLVCGEFKNKNGQNLRRGKGLNCTHKRISFGELEIEQILNNNNLIFIKEFSFPEEQQYNTHMKFDFYVSNSYIIEFDGEQHFSSIPTFGGEERFQRTQETDLIKNQYCLQHDIPIIRIPYWKRGKIELNDLLPEYSQFLIKEEKENVVLE